jgi:hypothetical protein
MSINLKPIFGGAAREENPMRKELVDLIHEAMEQHVV